MKLNKKCLIGLYCSLLFFGLSIANSAYGQSNCKVNDPDISQSYIGGCVDGLAHGKGTAKGRDTYVGEFRNGWPDGKGIYTWPDGNRYEGDSVEGKRTGKGVFTWSESYRNCGTSFCGKKYIGEFKESKQTCGKFEFWNGDSYEGCFEKDGNTMKGKTKFQLAEENRKYDRTRSCQHIYVGRSVVYDKKVWGGFLTGVVLGFSAQRGVATLRPGHSYDPVEVLCSNIEE